MSIRAIPAYNPPINPLETARAELNKICSEANQHIAQNKADHSVLSGMQQADFQNFASATRREFTASLLDSLQDPSKKWNPAETIKQESEVIAQSIDNISEKDITSKQKLKTVVANELGGEANKISSFLSSCAHAQGYDLNTPEGKSALFDVVNDWSENDWTAVRNEAKTFFAQELEYKGNYTPLDPEVAKAYTDTHTATNAYLNAKKDWDNALFHLPWESEPQIAQTTLDQENQQYADALAKIGMQHLQESSVEIPAKK